MTDFTLLNYPPHFGGMGKWLKNCQNLYMNKENKFLIPPVFAPFWGDIAYFAHFGGILAHFATHNGQKMGG